MSRLCVGLGFCLSHYDIELIIRVAPQTPRDFADLVVRLEGFCPETMDSRLYKGVLALIEEAMA